MSEDEMKMLRWMHYNTRKDKMRNSAIHKMVEVTPIEDKLREG